LSDLESFSDLENIEYLGAAIKKLAMPNHYQIFERFQAYDSVRMALVSIPGHARHYSNQVAAARKYATDILTHRYYRESCEKLLDTLPHLPSPETVQVLGEMLESRTDEPSQEALIDYLKRESRGSDVRLYYPSGMANVVFHLLGIRNFHEGTGPSGQVTNSDVEVIRSWWEEVKSGKRAFSFKGQAVEYRFKPDGTWDTFPIANPPDDGPKPFAAVLASPSEAHPGSSDSTSGKTMFKPWPWILIAMIGGLVLVIWGGLRRST
jgi:hypothetical protein